MKKYIVHEWKSKIKNYRVRKNNSSPFWLRLWVKRKKGIFFLCYKESIKNGKVIFNFNICNCIQHMSKASLKVELILVFFADICHNNWKGNQFYLWSFKFCCKYIYEYNNDILYLSVISDFIQISFVVNFSLKTFHFSL